MVYMKGVPPSFLQPFLWSYTLEKMDIESDKEIIIKNILDYGTTEATTWLRQTYSEAEIRSVISASASGDWGKKSLALWQLIYNVEPERRGRFA